MCGITGIFTKKNNFSSKVYVKLMNEKLLHRGPDNKNILEIDKHNFSIGHTRLSIIDLSENANQPVVSSSGRYILSYNGEIYNFKRIQLNLKNKNYYKNSDTKTLLESIEIFGLKKTLNEISGMFAFVLYDKKLDKIYLVRDRFGEKPLFYFKNEDHFIYASDISCFEDLPFVKKKISKKALNLFLSLSYVPSPLTIYENIFKVEPGEIIELDIKSFNISKTKWWSLEKKVLEYSSNQYSDESRAVYDLDLVFNNAIQDYLISDVPLGLFLSGGIDSSLVAYYAQKNSQKKLNTFSIKFSEQDYDESIYAERIAKTIGTNHNVLEVNKRDYVDVFEKMPFIYNEPFADSSQIPTFLVSAFAREKVTVCLSGDGGDELFGGYNRYVWIDDVWKIYSILPYSLRNIFLKIFSLLPKKIQIIFCKSLMSIISKEKDTRQLEDKINKFIKKFTNVREKSDIYFNLIDQNLLTETYGVKNFFKTDNIENNQNSLKELMTFLDIKYYLNNDILCKVDRASMFNSLEVRVPLLDKNIFEISQKIPISMKIKNGQTKYILKKLLTKYLDPSLINRPKMGFSIPLNKVLRSCFSDHMNDLFSFKKIEQHDFFNFKEIDFLFNQHKSHKNDNSTFFWNLLVFQSWYEKKKNFIFS